MKTLALALTLVCLLVMGGCTTPQGQTVTERQADVQQMKKDTIDELYAKQPASKDKMKQAVGYGVFTKTATAVFVGGTANGYGVITDKKTGKDTYMRAFTGTAGFGFGLKRFRLVILFYDPEVMSRFTTTGWDFSAQASAAATKEEEGGEVGTARTATRSMDVYEFTQKGVFLRADVKATRFWPDKSLNM
jgi:lipid-binding SYLF domain-containing protein